jgi:beta-lactamase regulating signal transducer with metallopeptidase domain/protocatechuate 3,4-dioxygenase beta subunit
MSWQFLASGSVSSAGLALTWLFQSTVLLTVGLVAGHLLRQRGPALQSAMYRTTLCAVVLCPLTSASLAAIGFSGLLIPLPTPSQDDTNIVAYESSGPDIPSPSRARESRSQLRDASRPQPQRIGVAANIREISFDRANDAIVALPMTANAPSRVWSHASPRWGDLIGWASAIVAAAWLVGALALRLRLMVGDWQTARLRSSAIDAEPEVLALCRDLARRMRVAPPVVLRSPFLCSPCLDGLRRPAILLPEDARDHLRETLIHELAHLGRRDGLWNLLRHSSTAVFWMQPLLWRLSKRLEATAEEICDDYVVGLGADRCHYAGHLLELAERRLPPLAPTGVGMISLRSLLARRITRILDSTRTLSTQAGRRAIAATLVAGLAGTFSVGLLGVGRGDRTARAQEPKAEKSSAADQASSKATAAKREPAAPMTVHGRVLDPDGKPVAGATEPETFKAFELTPNLKAEPGQVIDLGDFDATTGKPRKELNTPMPSDNEQGKGAARVTPITGRIVDLEGRPVAGAIVKIRGTAKPKAGNLDSWIDAVKSGEPPWIAYQHHLTPEPAAAPDRERLSATTDSQGRFRFEGLEAERVITIIIQGLTISYTSADVITRPCEPTPASGFPSSYGSEAQCVYGADFTYTAAPGRPVEGIVRDAKTGQPLAGVEVVSDHFAGAVISGMTDLKTMTDQQGRFRLVGLPKGSGNVITALPNEQQPYFVREIPVPDPPGMAPVQIEIALHKGIWIEGRVTDKVTGEPVPRSWLYYLPFLENRFAQATPEFDRNGNGPATTHQDRYQSKSDGTVRLVGLPGHAIVGVDSRSKTHYLRGDGSPAIKGMNQRGYFDTWRNPLNPNKLWPTSMKEVNLVAATKIAHVEFQLDPGAKVRMRAIDPQGNPVTGLKMAGRCQRGWPEFDVKPEAEFDVLTLAPAEDRMVLIRNEERKLGKVVHVKPGDDKNGPVTVMLEPLATIVGRVVDADGNPVSGATVRSDPQPGGDFSLHLNEVPSGKDGRFIVPDVPIGCEYNLVAESGLAVNNRRCAFFQNAKLLPGESTDVGEIRLAKVD